MNILHRINDYLYRIPQLIGVEVTREAGGLRLQAALVVRKKGRLLLQEGAYELSGTDRMREVFPAGIPVAVCLTGRGIVHRLLPAGQAAEGDALVPQVIPGADPIHFYHQQTPAGAQVMVSVARKEALDDLLADFETAGFRVLRVSLGPFSVAAFAPLFTGDDARELIAGPHRFTFSAGELSGYRTADTGSEPPGNPVIRLAGEEVSRLLLPAFAQGAAVLAGTPVPQPETGRPDELGEYTHRLLFRRLAVPALAGVLVLLLVNAFLFMHYTDQAAVLGTVDSRSIRQETDSLSHLLAARETLLRELLPHTDARPGIAVMAGSMIAGLPAAMLLEELSFYPPAAVRSGGRGKPVYRDAVRITGQCPDTESLQQWISYLRRQPWCSQAVLDTYRYDEKTDQGRFTITLLIQ